MKAGSCLDPRNGTDTNGRFELDGAQTEGGEALPHAEIREIADPCGVDMAHRLATDRVQQPRARAYCGKDEMVPVSPQWHALWTRSHCERLVWDQLTTKGFHAFLPTIDIWSRRSGVRHRIQVPMFPGYLFLHQTMDKASYIEVQKTRGLVCILGERWDRLAVVPDREVESIQTVLQARLPVLPHAYLRDGQRVRINRGPLASLEGLLVRQKPNQGLLVLSVELLKRSVAVEVDCTWVVPS